jgi:hypothetical protein
MGTNSPYAPHPGHISAKIPLPQGLPEYGAFWGGRPVGGSPGRTNVLGVWRDHAIFRGCDISALAVLTRLRREDITTYLCAMHSHDMSSHTRSVSSQATQPAGLWFRCLSMHNVRLPPKPPLTPLPGRHTYTHLPNKRILCSILH